MNDYLKVADVRVTGGDSSFLVYNDTVSILYDTGFGFNGDKLTRNIEEVLGERDLDYIFLTHSHYDHCLGTPYVKKRYPNAQVVAGEYTASVFNRPNAIAKMAELDHAHAKTCGIEEYEFLGDSLKVDIVVKDGDVVDAKGKAFRVIATPGHTKCCISFYQEDEGLFLSTETLGIYSREGVLPIILVSYEDAFRSIDRLIEIAPKKILVPHLGVLEGEDRDIYLKRVKDDCIRARDFVIEEYRQGKSRDEVVKAFVHGYLRPYLGEIYPLAAAYLNTSIMVDLIKREYID